jgi:carbon-monoxide dehydrogenase medium subunit
MTTHRDVERSAEIAAVLPVLGALASGIGDPQVRNRGTLGGSVANNDPAADYPAALLALDARVMTPDREIAADAFFKGLFETALAEHEPIVAVRFPVPRRAAYVKFPTPGSRYALVGVFVAETADGVRVAVTGAASGVFRARQIEAALEGSFEPAALDDVVIDPSELNDDMHGSAAYRGHLIKVIAQRAVTAALSSGGRTS